MASRRASTTCWPLPPSSATTPPTSCAAWSPSTRRCARPIRAPADRPTRHRGWHALRACRWARIGPPAGWAAESRRTTMSRRFNRRPPTEVERTARRHADRERLEQAARALLTSEGWQRWVKVRATNGLARYSLRNQWLIALDCHARGITPTYVAGFRAFLTLNRCVRKGEARAQDPRAGDRQAA